MPALSSISGPRFGYLPVMKGAALTTADTLHSINTQCGRGIDIGVMDQCDVPRREAAREVLGAPVLKYAM